MGLVVKKLRLRGLAGRWIFSVVMEVSREVVGAIEAILVTVVGAYIGTRRKSSLKKTIIIV